MGKYDNVCTVVSIAARGIWCSQPYILLMILAAVTDKNLENVSLLCCENGRSTKTPLYSSTNHNDNTVIGRVPAVLQKLRVENILKLVVLVASPYCDR